MRSRDVSFDDRFVKSVLMTGSTFMHVVVGRAMCRCVCDVRCELFAPASQSHAARAHKRSQNCTPRTVAKICVWSRDFYNKTFSQSTSALEQNDVILLSERSLPVYFGMNGEAVNSLSRRLKAGW